MMHRAWSSIKEVPYCFWRSYVKFQGHMALKIVEFDPNWAFPDSNSSLNSPMAMKCCTKLETAREVPYCFPRSSIKFQGHTGQNITDFDPNWAFPDYRLVAAFKSLRFALFYLSWWHIHKIYIHKANKAVGYIYIHNMNIIMTKGLKPSGLYTLVAVQIQSLHKRKKEELCSCKCTKSKIQCCIGDTKEIEHTKRKLMSKLYYMHAYRYVLVYIWIAQT